MGARNVQECLLIQIENLQRQDVTNEHIQAIIRDHWFDLGEHRYGAIAQALGISYDDVVAARDFMRQYLRPFPLERAGDGPNPTESSFVLPDVIIREENSKLVAEVVESRRFYLRLNPLYQELAQSAMRQQQDLSSEDREHLSTFVSRARLFLTNMRQRRETIRRIAECLIERQEDFLRYGVRHLTPLTRAEVPLNLPTGWNFEKVFGKDIPLPAPQSPKERDAMADAYVQLAVAEAPVSASAPQQVALPQTATPAGLLAILGGLMALLALAFHLLARAMTPKAA